MYDFERYANSNYGSWNRSLAQEHETFKKAAQQEIEAKEADLQVSHHLLIGPPNP